MQLSPAVIAAIQADAIQRYPEESCGVITAAGYVPLRNCHPTPLTAFDCDAECAALTMAGEVLGLVHSHPDGPEAPSSHDIASQRAMDIPWGLLMTDGEAVSQPYFWGDSLEPPPLLGRPFRHGPSGTDGKGDCGALIRDYFRIEHGLLIPDFARQDKWWMTPGVDLYGQHFAAAGFVKADQDNPKPGDVALLQVRVPDSNPVANHGGIFLGNHLMLHHLEGRLSRTEPVLGWSKMVRGWLRHAAL